MKISVKKFNERFDKFYRANILGKMKNWATSFGAAFILGADGANIDLFRDLFSMTKILVDQVDDAGEVVGEEVDIDKLKAGLNEAFDAVPEVIIKPKKKNPLLDLLGIEPELRFTKQDANDLYDTLTEGSVA